MSARTDQHEFNSRTFPAELVAIPSQSALTNKHEFKFGHVCTYAHVYVEILFQPFSEIGNL